MTLALFFSYFFFFFFCDFTASWGESCRWIPVTAAAKVVDGKQRKAWRGPGNKGRTRALMKGNFGGGYGGDI